MIPKLCLILAYVSVVFSSSCPQSVKDQRHLISLQKNCFEALYDLEKHDGQALIKTIGERVTKYKRMLQDMKMNNTQHLQTQPAIKWAQSESQIFLSIRLSHRHDSPTCSDIRKQLFGSDLVDMETGDLEKKVIQGSGKPNTSRLTFQSQCFYTNQKLMFTLDLTFNSTLQKVVVKKESFGRYNVVGTKLANDIWTIPFNGVQNAGIWSQMRKKYEKDMDNYFELLQAINEKKPSKTKKRFRTKSARMKYEMSGQL